MKTLTKIALCCFALSIALHLYLALHHYPLSLGFSTGPSLCSINQTFDCDAVSASAFSSFFGIPLAVWGMVTNFFIFGLLLISWIQWSEHPERLKRGAFFLSLVSVLGSIAMATISATMMSNYCLFCITLYVLSAIGFFCIYKTLAEPFTKNFLSDIPYYFNESKGVLGAFVLIPIVSFITHKAFLNSYGAGELGTVIQRSISTWKSNPTEAIESAPLLVSGPSREEARLVVTEFADFMCGHCKHAAPSIHAFANAHPDVRFEFFVFPLDGECNPQIQGASGIPCFLSKAVYCASKQEKGWDLHKLIFQNQDTFHSLGEKNLIRDRLKELSSKSSLNWDELLTCVDQPESQEAIQLQSKQGQILNIEGTPTFFANFKKLQGPPLIPLFEAVRNESPAK